ncbi:MAG: methylmalonyl-CoA epimerase [Candidatus Krumholzibacteria bacterium]|nr:methylmalonyl-CoA epimerase [Candidatus Krumholzibacteria bacterium]
MHGRLGKLEHIGIAVRDLEEAKRLYGDVLGFRLTGEKELPDRGLRVAFLETGNTKIELLQGMTPESAIARHIEKRGPGIQHLCFSVDDIRRVMGELKADGVEMIDAEPRRGAEGRLVAFMHPRSTLGVLLELEEK